MKFGARSILFASCLALALLASVIGISGREWVRSGEESGAN